MHPPYSAPHHAQAQGPTDAYSQASPAVDYGHQYTGPGYAETPNYYGAPEQSGDDSATTLVASPNSASAIRRWKLIAALAVAAAALVIIGFFLFGLGNRDGAAAPVTSTVTEVTEFEGAETTRTNTTTATATERETRTATETERETETVTQTATRTTTIVRSVPGDPPPAVTCTTTVGGDGGSDCPE